YGSLNGGGWSSWGNWWWKGRLKRTFQTAFYMNKQQTDAAILLSLPTFYLKASSSCTMTLLT
ncbi:hypothetical protein, partial [Neisseria elongata]|uniref:hypothetical protein n=1 Tax=Neisseria elongata TaxID=495 RepID=UPI001F43C45A